MTELVQHGLVEADGRVEPMDGAWTVVESVGNGIERLLAVDGEVPALRRRRIFRLCGTRGRTLCECIGGVW